MPDNIRLALVLGGGGARGLAHIGVLEEFERANIPIDIIVGCSAGSLVGAMYADCPNAAYCREILEPMNLKKFLDINIWKAWYGLAQGDAMRKTLQEHLTATTFDELQIPLLIVATDLYTGDLCTIGGGPIIPAVQSSCAVPMVYCPVQHLGRVFVDGGVIDPVPVCVAKRFDPEMIVVVDLECLLPRTFPKNIWEVGKRSAEITLLWQSKACLQGADVVIRPELDQVGTFEDGLNEVIYEAGRKAAREAIPQILGRLNEIAQNKNKPQEYTVH